MQEHLAHELSLHILKAVGIPAISTALEEGGGECGSLNS